MSSHVQRSALVPYAAEKMYSLVNDVEAYPLFLPHCRSARILERQEHVLLASIDLAKGALHRSFTTRNLLEPPHRIHLQLVQGPFRSLSGHWEFTALEKNRTRVALDLEFEFANRLLALAVGPVFHHLANSLVDAFVDRAQVVYGKALGSTP